MDREKSGGGVGPQGGGGGGTESMLMEKYSCPVALSIRKSQVSKQMYISSCCVNLNINYYLICNLMKKLSPGTKFAIDAFRYGQIEGIAAYFLTHFHSDHYGGLTKTSTVPIYCNRVSQSVVLMK